MISVIIPAYNSQNTIISCVESAVNQTFKDLEIIVVDDGSTDDTVAMLEGYKSRNNIENLLIIKKKNEGPSSARNLGINIARGKYIAFLDSDDKWIDVKLEKQIICFNDNQVALVGCRYQIGDHKDQATYKKEVIDISFKKLLFSNYFITSSVICSSHVLRKNLFDEKQKYSEDYAVWLKIAALSKCVLLDDCLLELNNKPIFGFSGLSSKLWKMERGELLNYLHLRKNGIISSYLYYIVATYSISKFIKRVIQVRILNCFSKCKTHVY